MRESCTYGSVRGARGNSRPYRDGARHLVRSSRWKEVASAQRHVRSRWKLTCGHS